MAGKTFSDFSRFIRVLDKELYSARTMKQLGERTKNIIYKRVKRGVGVVDDQAKRPRAQKLKPLSRSYVEQRRKRGVRGEFGSPSRSNLTNTGQMLDSFKVLSTSNTFKVVIPSTNRRGDRNTNRQIADFVRKDRPFFALTSAEVKIVEKDIRDLVRKIFDKTF